MSHTTEPWEVKFFTENGREQPYIIQSEKSADICQGEPDPRFVCAIGCSSPTNGWGEEDITNAQRIVACVNFCAGVSTETLNALVEAILKSDAVRKDIIERCEQWVRLNPHLFADSRKEPNP